jgi:hypothetical protein
MLQLDKAGQAIPLFWQIGELGTEMALDDRGAVA